MMDRVYIFLAFNPGCTPEQLKELARMACCSADDGEVYQLSVATDATAPKPVQLDASALGDRLVIAVQNAGGNIVEYKFNQSQWTFGQGFQILPGGIMILGIKANLQVWVQCAPGLSTDLRTCELGQTQAAAV